MKTQVMTQEDIRTRGINVLAKELGVVGMVRFVHYGHSMSDIPDNSELLALLDEINASDG